MPLHSRLKSYFWIIELKTYRIILSQHYEGADMDKLLPDLSREFCSGSKRRLRKK
jgi:hypothetical protein